MKNIKLLKPQPSPKNTRDPLTNITNCFQSRSRLDKQAYRSPSYSPKQTSRVTLFEKEGREGRKHGMLRQYTETKFANNVHRCVNHKEKTGKFKVESENSPFYYCQNCAVELNQRGKRLTSAKCDDLNTKMVNQAKQYVRTCDQVLFKLAGKLSELKAEKVKVDCTYHSIQEDMESQRMTVLKQINEKYDKEIRQQENERKKMLNRLEEEEFRLGQFENELRTVKVDIADNMKEINVSIENVEFREIMDIYWNKITQFDEILTKICPNVNITESSQAFIQKYLPPIDFHPKIDLVTHTTHSKTPSQNGKQFTFSKNYWDFERAKEANSWEYSKSEESGESYVQQRIKIV